MKKMKQKAKRFSVILITAIIAIGCLGCISAAAFTKTEKSTYKGLTKTQKYSAKDACYGRYEETDKYKIFLQK